MGEFVQRIVNKDEVFEDFVKEYMVFDENMIRLIKLENEKGVPNRVPVLGKERETLTASFRGRYESSWCSMNGGSWEIWSRTLSSMAAKEERKKDKTYVYVCMYIY